MLPQGESTYLVAIGSGSDTEGSTSTKSTVSVKSRLSAKSTVAPTTNMPTTNIPTTIQPMRGGNANDKATDNHDSVGLMRGENELFLWTSFESSSDESTVDGDDVRFLVFICIVSLEVYLTSSRHLFVLADSSLFKIITEYRSQ